MHWKQNITIQTFGVGMIFLNVFEKSLIACQGSIYLNKNTFKKRVML